MIRVDPPRGYNFLITLVDSTSSFATAFMSIARAPAGGFSECSGLEANLDLEEYREGGRNDAVLKFPTRVTWSNIRLRRGVALSDELWAWHNSFVRGLGSRRDGVIVLQDDLQTPIKAWGFTRGLPMKWTGPSLDAGQSRVAIEELDIAHEGLQLLPSGGGA